MGEILAFSVAPKLPRVFRLTSISRQVFSKGYHLTARVFHAEADFEIEWHSNFIDTRLVPGVLVRVIWKQSPNQRKASLELAAS